MAVLRDRSFLMPTSTGGGMGFGSYDESEQQDQSVDEDEEREGINVHENEHDGEVTVESDVSADGLIDQLQEIKADDGDAEE
jgi:hypothetical protein